MVVEWFALSRADYWRLIYIQCRHWELMFKLVTAGHDEGNGLVYFVYLSEQYFK
jgi:hypothetical protein